MSNHVNIAAVDWQQQRDRLLAVRTAVFVDEQGFPGELEVDNEDAGAQHFIAETQGLAIGTTRLTPSGQIGRMAVLQAYRHSGIGSQLMAAIVAHATDAGYQRLYLNAQTHAIEFYSRFGFVVSGAIFMEEQQPHQAMELILS
jgi:predicted GNAT family N-acyltransferase